MRKYDIAGMKIRLVIILLLLSLSACGQDTRLLFWNLENFFDYHDDSLSVADREFSSFGERHWTKKRFYVKCNAVAKALLWIGEQRGGMPDILAFAEIENRFVLKKLLTETALRKLDYRIVHYDSPDPRGIDVALLYRGDRWDLLSSKPCRVGQTRDILQVSLGRKGAGDSLAILVNHHPSKYGGATASQIRRQAAVDRLRSVADSLMENGERRIVALGDFNDTPDNPLYRRLSPPLFPLADSLHRAGRGTIRFNGRWELIDLGFVSSALLPAARMEILSLPFLMVRDSSHPGDKPLRTYEGPRYRGGVSDHLPIYIVIK